MINSLLWSNWPPSGGGLGGRDLPNWATRNSEWLTVYFDQFGRPLGAGWGRGLAQLSNKKVSIVNGSLWPICRPLGAGLGLGTCPTEQQEILNDEHFTSINLATPWGRVRGRGSALLEEHENFNTNFPLRPISRPNRSKWKFLLFFSKSVEVKIYFIFGRRLGAGLRAGLVQVSKMRLSMINSSLWSIWPPPGGGLGAGSCPTEQQKILNCEWFTSTDLPPPGGGFGAGNLPNWTTRNSQWWTFHFDQFGRPQRAGFGAGKCSTGRTWKFQYKFFILTDLEPKSVEVEISFIFWKIGRSENRFHFWPHPGGRFGAGDLSK